MERSAMAASVRASSSSLRSSPSPPPPPALPGASSSPFPSTWTPPTRPKPSPSTRSSFPRRSTPPPLPSSSTASWAPAATGAPSPAPSPPSSAIAPPPTLKVVRIQRQRRILKQRLKVPPTLHQFTHTLYKNLVKDMNKYVVHDNGRSFTHKLEVDQ
ncbi:hypothetical protein ZWY2020_037160 [Hordeum vulgare]|nr:hypothetical protein ZWY2020_037160 [Hordeum vulgare]